MKKTLAVLLALSFLAVPVDFADARGGRGPSARGGSSRSADRARKKRRDRDGKLERVRDGHENRDGLLRDVGRDAV